MADISNNTFWSETDANNNSTPPNGFPEGMLPSAVNNSARNDKGALKRFWNRINGTLTTAGTASAYTLTYSVAPASYVAGEIYTFIAHVASAATPTLNVNTLGAITIKRTNLSALQAGDIAINQPVSVVYTGTEFAMLNTSATFLDLTSTTLMRNDNGTGAATSRLPSTTGLDIGGTSNRWGTVWATTFDGTSTAAQYSDLAERYECDVTVEPGDVVKLGGEKEITHTTHEGCTQVFGVISTQPGFMLNAHAGNDYTHPYVALSGRVPCKVRGKVEIGQRLISSDTPGIAIGIDDSTNINPFAVIGRALKQKKTSNIGTVEIVVGSR